MPIREMYYEDHISGDFQLSNNKLNLLEAAKCSQEASALA